MRIRRLAALLVLLPLLLGGLARPPAAGAVGAWTPTAPRPAPPGGTAAAPDTATTLANGRVLITGSYAAPDGRPVGTSEAYDPAADRWGAAVPFDPNGGRAAPTLLPDGRILFIGGVAFGGTSPGSMRGLAAAQAYDPATGTWAAVAPMHSPRRDHTATLLPDGTVLVVSGDAGSPFYSPSPVVGVERYDPRADRWTAVAPLARARFGHGAALLRDGRVLVFGGYGDPTATIYDPAADRWSPAAGLPAGGRGDYAQRAIVLPDGRVLALALGGYDLAPTLSVYDPAADRWAIAPPPPPAARAFSPLPGGRVLAIGADTRIYDPALDAWVGAPPPADPGAPQPTDPTVSPATPLRDGRVLLVGARGGQIYADDPAPRACFAETGQCVGGRFLEYWLANGGLARNGFPLTSVRIETLEDGNAYQVQYFERVRLEYHPENAYPYDVLLGQFGRRVLESGASGVVPDTGPAAPQAGATYFPETGHNVGGSFIDYWRANGGLAQFGFPLTELHEERLVPGSPTTYLVQYFERARFEYHPENAPPYDVELGQFGRQILTENDLLGTATGTNFGLLYIGNAEVRRALGTPAAPRALAPGSAQAFERGRMYYRGDTGRVYVFCGGVTGIVLLAPGGETSFPDTWAEGQDPGGGPASQPGLFYPQRGFGKLWRENQRVRDCLGYARSDAEEGYTFAAQEFRRGLMLAGAPSAGRTIYIVALGPFGNGTGPDATYAPYPNPTP